MSLPLQQASRFLAAALPAALTLSLGSSSAQEVGTGARAGLPFHPLADGRVPNGDLPTGSFVECTRLVHSFQGEAQGDQFGWVSAPLPDVDGDGVLEVVVTAPFTGANRGRIYVHSGASGEELFRAQGGNGWRLGFAARSARDVNGDGFSDVIAGAPGNPFNVAGRARIYSGDPADAGAPLRTISYGVPQDAFGSSVAGLGDLDGDLVPDLAIGAPGDDTAGLNAGRVWVVSGADASVLWTVDGESAGDAFGSSVAFLTDVTGDGRDELVVGAPTAGSGGGKAYVYDAVLQSLLYELLPDATAGSFGQYFAADVGDVDDDGFHDVYIDDFNDSENGAAAGKAYVFDGETGARIWTIPGESAGDGFGIGRGAGDVNGDGHADLLLCGWIDGDGAPGAGKARVFSGLDLSVLQTITSTTPGENLGFDAHRMGDVDGDGAEDYFLTAASNGELANLAGKCYLVAGGPLSRRSGSGVPGTGGIEPDFAPSPCPRMGEEISISIVGGRGGAFGALAVGLEPANLPLGAGTLLVDPLEILPHVLDGPPAAAGAGTALLELAVPFDPALLGERVLLQAAYQDPAAAGTLSMTDRLELSIVQP